MTLRLGSIAAFALAWLAGFALWMLLTDSVRPIEIFAGAGIALLGASGFELVRRQRITEQAFMPQLMLGTWRVLLKAFPDVLRLTRAAFAQLARPEPARGRLVAMHLGYGAAEPYDRAHRAVATGLGSIAPNSIVVGVDEHGMILVHQLEPTHSPSDLDPLKLR